MADSNDIVNPVHSVRLLQILLPRFFQHCNLLTNKLIFPSNMQTLNKEEQKQRRHNELNDLYPKAQTLCVQLCTQHDEHPGELCDLLEKFYTKEKAPYMRDLGTRTHLGRSDPIDANLPRRVDLQSLVVLLVFFGLVYVAVLMMGRYVDELQRRWRRMKRRRRRRERGERE